MNKLCYIICGGPERIDNVEIEKDAYIICADSGFDKALRINIKPNLIIGDFDSIKNDLPPDIGIIRLPEHKDDTDTFYCVRIAIEKGFNQIILLGACSGRADHFIANIQTLKYICQNNCYGAIKGDTTELYYLSGNSTLKINKNDSYLSVFALQDNSVVSINGAEYNVEKAILNTDYPIGVSNKIIKDEAQIQLFQGEIIVMSVKEIL